MGQTWNQKRSMVGNINTITDISLVLKVFLIVIHSIIAASYLIF